MPREGAGAGTGGKVGEGEEGGAESDAGPPPDPLDQYLSWMEDEGAIYTCCMDDPNVQETDPEAFDCEGCLMREYRSRLGEDDARAMDLYQLFSLGVVKELGLYPMVWAVAGIRTTREGLRALLLKMQRIHRHHMWKVEQDNGGGGATEDTDTNPNPREKLRFNTDSPDE